MPQRLVPLIPLLLFGCADSRLAPLTNDERAEFLDSLVVADSRPFYLGFTPWPYDFTEAAQDETYDYLAEHGDLVLYHLDNGVPWPEALAGDPFPDHVQGLLDRMRSESSRFEKLYVSATPQSQDRETLSRYWNEDEHQPLPSVWEGRAFDHPDVIAAYTAYCRRLIDFFEPDYFAYGIEVNGALTRDHPSYDAFRILVANVHATLKAEYPDLPIFLTFQTGSFEATWEEQQAVNRDLIQFSDIVGMSTYPFWVPGLYAPDDADVSYLPANWFEQIADIAPEKPFAITETGYIAEDFSVAGVSMRGRELWQAVYTDRLMRSLHALDAEFVIWFVVRDYDLGWDYLVDVGADNEAFLIWKDTGLLDGQGADRLGLEVWDRWLATPRR